MEKDKITEQEVINSISFIRLETTDDCLLDEVEEVRCHKGLFYILDQKENLFVFDRTGKFIRKIGNRGPGPEEYVEVTCFYIHPKKEYICLLSIATSQAVRYTLDGKFSERLKINYNQLNAILPGNVSLLDGENLLIESSNSVRFCHQYLVMDETTLTGKSYKLPYAEVGEENCSFGMYGKNMNAGKDFFALSMYNDTVFKWQKDKFIPALVLESGLKHPTPEIIKKYGPYEFIYDAAAKLNRNGYSVGVDNICTTDRYLYLDYFGLGYYDAIFWDIHAERGRLFRHSGGKNPLLNIFNELVTTNQDYLVRVMSPDMFYMAEEGIKSSNHPDIPDLYKNLKEDDNPVLILYDYNKLMGEK